MDLRSWLMRADYEGCVTHISPIEPFTTYPFVIRRNSEENFLVSEQNPVSVLSHRFACGDDRIQAAMTEVREKLISIRFNKAHLYLFMGCQKVLKNRAERALGQRRNQSDSDLTVVNHTG